MTTPPDRAGGLRRLAQYARPHRRTIALGLGLGALATAAELVTPLVTKSVLDGLETSSPLRGAVTLLAVLLVAGSVLGFVQTVVLGTLAERVVFAARNSMVGHLLRIRVPEVADRPSGELVSRVTSDTVLLREATTSSIVNLVNGVIGLVGALALMAYLDLVLFVVTIGVLLVVVVSSSAMFPALGRAQREAQEQLGRRRSGPRWTRS